MNMMMPIRLVLPNARPQDLPPIFSTYDEVMRYFLPIRDMMLLQYGQEDSNNPFLKPLITDNFEGLDNIDDILAGDAGHFVEEITQVYTLEEQVEASNAYRPAYVEEGNGIALAPLLRGSMEGMRFKLGETLRERNARLQAEQQPAG